MDAPSRLAHPAHLAMFNKLLILLLVEHSWAMAARATLLDVDGEDGIAAIDDLVSARRLIISGDRSKHARVR
eukprot:13839213-Ditylum_brightwellii.AAC.1